MKKGRVSPTHFNHAAQISNVRTMFVKWQILCWLSCYTGSDSYSSRNFSRGSEPQNKWRSQFIVKFLLVRFLIEIEIFQTWGLFVLYHIKWDQFYLYFKQMNWIPATFYLSRSIHLMFNQKCSSKTFWYFLLINWPKVYRGNASLIIHFSILSKSGICLDFHLSQFFRRHRSIFNLRIIGIAPWRSETSKMHVIIGQKRWLESIIWMTNHYCSIYFSVGPTNAS